MTTPSRTRARHVLALATLLAACSDAPTAPPPELQAAVTGSQPLVVPIYEVFPDASLCGGAVTTSVIEGEARVQTVGDRTVINVQAKVYSTDGLWSGKPIAPGCSRATKS